MIIYKTSHQPMFQFSIMYTKLALLVVTATVIGALPPESSDKRMHPVLPVVPKNRFKDNIEETTSDYWRESAQKTVENILKRKVNKRIAKNVILFLGDGMSIPTLAAARVYNGGEETRLAFEKFDYTGLSKTYAVDRQVPDSANTATAYLCGIKANYGTIGIGPEIFRGDCEGMANPAFHALSIAYHSQLKNKSTGLVTTARVTHASPSGVYAHTANREWESDADILSDGQNPTVCKDIAKQLVEGETGKNLNVIMGGGRSRFLPTTVTDQEGQKGIRKDGVNLIEKWLAKKRNAQFIWNRNQLLSLRNVDNVMGLFSHTHLDYNLDRNKRTEPSLAEMTKAAINILKKNDKGYFLFVEGAEIDIAHHETEAKIALDETVEFSKAVQTAVDMTDESDTLILVTSDHAHTMSVSGYATRGNDIFEFPGQATDGKVLTTISYANGPGYRRAQKNGERYVVTNDKNFGDNHYKYPAIAPLDAETHGGDDVAIFARGPWAHLFTGVLEQNVIPHLLSFASCVGEGLTACNDPSHTHQPHSHKNTHRNVHSEDFIEFEK